MNLGRFFVGLVLCFAVAGCGGGGGGVAPGGGGTADGGSATVADYWQGVAAEVAAPLGMMLNLESDGSLSGSYYIEWPDAAPEVGNVTGAAAAAGYDLTFFAPDNTKHEGVLVVTPNGSTLDITLPGADGAVRCTVPLSRVIVGGGELTASAAQGHPGEEIIVSGHGLFPVPAANTVYFGPNRAQVSYAAADRSHIKVVVPGQLAGRTNLTLVIGGRQVTLPFTVLAAPPIVIDGRWTATAVTGATGAALPRIDLSLATDFVTKLVSGTATIYDDAGMLTTIVPVAAFQVLPSTYLLTGLAPVGELSLQLAYEATTKTMTWEHPAQGAFRKLQPACSGLSATSAVAGETIEIRGSGFSPLEFENTVRFGDLVAEVVPCGGEECAADVLTVRVPQDVRYGVNVSVAVGSESGVCGTVFYPKVAVAVPGVTVMPDVWTATMAGYAGVATLTGMPGGGAVTVTFRDSSGAVFPVEQLGAVDEESVAFRIPAGLMPGRGYFTVVAADTQARLTAEVTVGGEVPPISITGVQYLPGAGMTDMWISGSGFSLLGNMVGIRDVQGTYWGVPFADVAIAAPGTLVVRLPDGVPSGRATLSILGRNGAVGLYETTIP